MIRMTRADRFCRDAPSWMLRMLLALPSWRNWWAAAYLELWNREVAAVVEVTSDNEGGPWPTSMPGGRH